MKYIEVLCKMAAQDAWKPTKLEMPKGFKMPSLKLPTWNDIQSPEKQQKERDKQRALAEKKDIMENPGSMEVTIKYRR